MRFVIFGAGAIGGVVGGRLAENGHDVILIARGPHHDAIASSGLRLDSPSRSITLELSVVSDPAALAFSPDDVVLLAVKSQDTVAAIDALAAIAPPTAPVVCLQNGVANEPAALRRFANVYGVPVMCPTAHLEPGVVIAYSEPVTGILDVGRFPAGVDAVAEAVAGALVSSTFSSRPCPDVARWKWGKLITNLGNAVEAVCGPPARRGPIGARAAAEGIACVRAAGIDFVSDDEDRGRRGDLLQLGPVGDTPRPGGSSWQSLARGTGVVETDYLNGEIVLLGRLHGVPTPVNERLQLLANEMARTGAMPGGISPEELLSGLDLADR